MKASDDAFTDRSIDQQLKQLAIVAQQQAPKSRERQRVLARFIAAIERSGKLTRPRRGEFQGFYQEVYAEAVQRLFTHVCEKIDTYNPERGEVLQWMNFLLSRQFFPEAIREVFSMGAGGVDPRRGKRFTLEDLDRADSRATNSAPLPSQQVLECLQEDPEGRFQQASIAGHPAANFHFLAMQRLAGYSWQELSAELGIPIPTLSSFYQRCLTKFALQIKEYVS